MVKKRVKTTRSLDGTSTAHTWPVIAAIIVCVFAVGLGVMMRETTKLSVPTSIVNQLNRLAFQGKLTEVKQLVKESNELDWTALGKQGGGMTAIHHALHGRHHSLTMHSGPLIGKHEELVEYLVHHLHWDPDVGCPVYLAVHLRNLPVLQTLLKASDKSVSLTCLTSLDVNGETALHSAVKSKAAGLARLYSKLLTFDGSSIVGSPPHHVIASLLGLAHKSPSLTGSGELSHSVLNKLILHTDIQLIVDHFGSRLNLSISDWNGNTLLHNAAYGGRVELVTFLLQLGSNSEQRNHHGVTPLQLAMAAGHGEVTKVLKQHSSEIRDMSETFTCSRNQSKDWLRYTRWSQYLASNWIAPEEGDRILHELPECSCTLPVVSASSLSYEDFMHSYLARRKPVLITGLVDSWPAWNNWKKNEILKRYGDLEFTASRIPYADLYLNHHHHPTVTTTLTQYVNSFDNTSKSPLYVFDGRVLELNASLSTDCPVPYLFENSSITLRQFILGPRNSGAPPHFHSSVFNVLVYGMKHWLIWQPHGAFFSFTPMDSWMTHHASHSAEHYCYQLPGDVLFLPEGWGHAVINKQHSVAVAMEFT